MKLAFRFTLSFVLITIVVWGAASYVRVQREVDLFERDIRRDHETIGFDLAAAVEDIRQLGGEDAAYRFVDQANQSRAEINIRLVSLDSSVGLQAPVIRDMLRSTTAPIQQAIHAVVDSLGHEWQYSYIIVPGGLYPRTAIELEESLAERDKYVRLTIWRSVFYTSLVGVLSGLIAMALGIVYVARPIRALIDRARRVASGDLSSKVELHQGDELGLLGNEINSMTKSLAAAQERIEAETAARQKTVEQLRHADRLSTVGKLASVVAHELGTPLNSIRMRARMIAEGEVAGPEVVESSQTIVSEATRMAESIRRLLDLSRRRAPQREQTDLRLLVQQTVTLLEPLARKNNVQLEVEPISSPLQATVDPEHIRQVLSNLMTNAVEAMPNGGRLTVALNRQTDIDTESASSSEFAVISVGDTGVGIDAQHLDKLFDPFFTTKDRQAGTGLGLSISAEIVREHNGRIEVESEAGSGTRFDIYLPLITETQDEGNNARTNSHS